MKREMNQRRNNVNVISNRQINAYLCELSGMIQNEKKE